MKTPIIGPNINPPILIKTPSIKILIPGYAIKKTLNIPDDKKDKIKIIATERAIVIAIWVITFIEN